MSMKNYNPKENGNIKQKPQDLLMNYVLTIILVFCLILSSFAYASSQIFSSAVVEGLSMFPTINSKYNKGDIAYYKKNSTINRGDIIIINYKEAQKNIDAIKRVIALEGDTICYYNGKILINGSPLAESYLDEDYKLLGSDQNALKIGGFVSAVDWKTEGFNKSKDSFENWCRILLNDEENKSSLAHTDFFTNYKTKYSNCIKYSTTLQAYMLTIPKGFVYFLGDNRKVSNDSSIIGPLPTTEIDGKVSFIVQNDATTFNVFGKKIINMFK